MSVPEDRPPATEANAVHLLYQSYLDMAKVFLEWRHKVMMLWLALTSVLMTVSGWMYDRELHGFFAAPLFFGGLFSFMAMVMDTRNQAILSDYYEKSAALARGLGDSGGGPLATMPRTQGWRGMVRYRTALLVAYGLTGCILTGLAVGFTLAAAFG